MNRVARRVILFLLLGATINIAVAWGFTRVSIASMPYAPDSNEADGAIIHALRRHMVMQGMAMMLCAHSENALGRARHEADLLVGIPVIDQQPRHLVAVTVWEYGWPLRALRHERWQEPKRPMHDASGIRSRSAKDDSSWDVPPLDFTLNTTLYAVIVWMLFAFPGAARRRIRAHRGRCIACGYDLRGRASESKLCSECGHCAVEENVPCG